VLYLPKYAYILLVKEKLWKRRIAQNRAGKKVQAFVRKNAVDPRDTTLLLFYHSSGDVSRMFPIF